MLAKKCFLVGIVTLFSVSLAMADPPAVHPVTGEELVIDCLRGAPEAIDGDLSDWNLEAMTPAVLDAAEQLYSGQDSWTGPEDCSGEFYVLWDDVNIYMAVVVKDDKLSMNKTDGNIWNADAIEVFFSTLNAVAGHAEHYQYGFNANNQRWNWCNMDGAGSTEPDYLQIASSATDDGYICEASVEYGQMPSLDFSAGNTVGFHPVLDDTDNGDRELQMTWTGREAHDQSLGFGHMILSADPVPVPAERSVLLAEDFEGLALGPNVDEALAGDAVWTDTPPEGWSIDESGVPGIGMDATDGITEWAGWAFTDKAWWTEAAEDQRRSEFTLGQGTVAVADPDEWADGERLPIPISADPYDTWLSTPAIDISGVAAGTLELKFDSSWRPEFDDDYHQTANITATYDGGDPVEVLLWESDESSANYKPDATNETVVVDLDIPEGARNLVLTFGLFDAGNDWWWAIDNVEVSGVLPEPVPVNPGNDGLLAWWACDEGEGAVVADISGNGRDGTFVNGDPVWVEGVQGSAVELVGPTLIETPPLNMELTEATMAGWIKPYGPQPDWSSIIMQRDPGLATGFNILGYQLAYHWNDTSDSWGHRGGDMIAEDDWTFAAVTIEPDKASFYVNGEPGSVNEVSHGPCMWDSNVYLGGDGTEGWVARRMIGALDDVAMYDRALSVGEVMFLAGQRETPVDPGDNGLVAFYAMENDVLDSSGNELHGTIVGEAAFVEGPAGMALTLDGVDDLVDLGNPDVLNFATGDWTVSAWIKTTDADKGTVYANGGDNSGGVRYTLAVGENTVGKMTLTTDDDSTKRQARGGTIVNDDVWHHVVGMRNGDTSLVFVDGDLDGSIDLPVGYDLSGTSQANALIGAITDARDATGATLEKFFGGTLDEVVLYGRALSGGEVRYLAGFRPPPENLLANGGFEDGVVEPWSTYGAATTEVVQDDPVEGAYCLHVTVSEAGVNFWDSGLQHTGHVFEAGKNYTLSAYLKCSQGTLDINFKPELGESPWTGYGSQAFTMTEEWAEYSVTTGVFDADVSPATITFHIGYAAADFYVDDVRFVEVE